LGVNRPTSRAIAGFLDFFNYIPKREKAQKLYNLKGLKETINGQHKAIRGKPGTALHF
jgi:hypothetical protein